MPSQASAMILNAICIIARCLEKKGTAAGLRDCIIKRIRL